MHDQLAEQKDERLDYINVETSSKSIECEDALPEKPGLIDCEFTTLASRLGFSISEITNLKRLYVTKSGS